MKNPSTVQSKIETDLLRLEVLERSSLVNEWYELHGTSSPKGASLKFLRRALAYEMQSKFLPSLTKQELKQLNGVQNSTTTPTTSITKGTRLVREWNGKPHVVQVLAEGFVYKDKVWKSLSAIARDITGAHWSGPRFFGVSGART